MIEPSLHKYNIRYRGPAEGDKNSNIVYEIIHDINKLDKVIDGDESNSQEKFINDNFLYMIYGLGIRHGNLSDEYTPIDDHQVSNDVEVLFSAGIKNRINRLEAKIKFLSEQL